MILGHTNHLTTPSVIRDYLYNTSELVSYEASCELVSYEASCELVNYEASCELVVYNSPSSSINNLPSSVVIKSVLVG